MPLACIVLLELCYVVVAQIPQVGMFVGIGSVRMTKMKDEEQER
jgi:hypothetical protein